MSPGYLAKIINKFSEASGMKLPGPDHPITIACNAGRVRVVFRDKVIADTTRALTLREASYPPVQYIPRADIAMDLLKPTAREPLSLQGRRQLFHHRRRRKDSGERGVEL
jgi:hypothetical protein